MLDAAENRKREIEVMMSFETIFPVKIQLNRAEVRPYHRTSALPTFLAGISK